MSDPPVLRSPEGERVELRAAEAELPDDVQLVRFLWRGDMIGLAKASADDWQLYAGVLSELGYGGHGALVLSSFALWKGWTMAEIAEGTPYTAYHQTSAKTFRDNGYEVWPTRTWNSEGIEDWRSAVHYDVVVTRDPDRVATLRDRSAGTAERRLARRALAPMFERVLELWGPPMALPSLPQQPPEGYESVRSF